jgi:hypothetical protein
MPSPQRNAPRRPYIRAFFIAPLLAEQHFQASQVELDRRAANAHDTELPKGLAESARRQTCTQLRSCSCRNHVQSGRRSIMAEYATMCVSQRISLPRRERVPFRTEGLDALCDVREIGGTLRFR